MRILLYGAFGNHNIGDDWCFAAAIQQIHAILPDAELTVSPLRNFGRIPDFPADYVKILSDNIMQRVEEVNRYDALVIGPGGLFEWPHEPFMTAGWAEAVRAPLYLFAVGVWPHRRYRRLFNKASFIGVRDELSLRSAQLMSGGVPVTLMPDPVLASDFPVPLPKPLGGFDTGFVLRQWLPQAYDERVLMHSLRSIASESSLFLGFEGGICEGASRQNDDAFSYEVYAGGTHVPYLPDPAALMAYVASCRKIIAMRLHGVILAFRAGIPAAGIAYLPKVQGLYDLMGLSKFCIRPQGATGEWFRSLPWDEMPELIESGLMEMREKYTQAMICMKHSLKQL